MAKSLGAWLGELRYRRFPAREEPAWDLIGWTCWHRGLTHRIASVLLQTGGFSLESVKSALEAAKRVKAVKTVQVLKASATLAALEGEKVTGLKPVVLGKGGRGRGGGSWRGRSGRGR